MRPSSTNHISVNPLHNNVGPVMTCEGTMDFSTGIEVCVVIKCSVRASGGCVWEPYLTQSRSDIMGARPLRGW